MLHRPSVGRLGLIGDVHGARPQLERALEHFARAGVDAVAAVGDFLDGPPDEVSDFDGCLDSLRQEQVICVRGNHDRWALEDLYRSAPNWVRCHELRADNVAFLETLPATFSFDTPQGEAVLCHAVGRDDMSFINPDTPVQEIVQNSAYAELRRAGVRFVLCGHTHQHMVRHVDGTTIINAGALRMAAFPGFTLVDFEAAHVEYHPFERPSSAGVPWQTPLRSP